MIFLLSGCADSVQYELTQNTEMLGFWYGLLHGIILPFSWIVSLFKSDVAVYAINNNGGWYDSGFVIGILMFWGSSSKASRRKK